MRGLVRFHTAFLRTPKKREGEGTWLQALKSAQMEVLLAASGLGLAVAMVVRAPSFSTAAIALLLLFQAWVYANAPWASAAAEGIQLTPLRRAYRHSPQDTGAWPTYDGATLLGVPALVGAIVLAMILFATFAAPPPPQELTQPAPVKQSPKPSASPSASPSPSPSPSPSSSPSPSPSPSAQ